ncbi:MAG TPA: hypothetical protein VG711_08955, partial [Phycisphaerales bacterium]|nr:hypothetical protein [Phycisphaerales bacterium]
MNTTLKALSAASLSLAILCLSAPSSAAGNAGSSKSGQYKGDFNISKKSVVPDERYIARFRVLGAEITSGGKYDLPVTASIKIGSTTYEPFGPISSPTKGNVNDHHFPKDFIMPDNVSAGTAFTVLAKSWQRAKSYTDGKTDAQFSQYMAVNSSDNSANMAVLRNGDKVPTLAGFSGQASIKQIVNDYVNAQTGTVVLNPDE